MKWLCLGLMLTATPSLAEESFPAEQIERGHALALAGDCVACHSIPGGKEFAGGLGIDTPIGRIYSTNITPDPKSGIGAYSFEDFDKALRKGVAKDGHALYPAMPYPSYALVSEVDAKALYAYFMKGVEAADTPNRSSDILWPMSMRWPLRLWGRVFAKTEPFQPDPSHDAAWNRGAYLVEGLGHCGSCHTPRGIGFQEKAMSPTDGADYLAGARIDGWFAKSLRGEQASGLGAWTEADILQFLKTGRTSRSAVFASMAEVVSHSTQFMAENDLLAMAHFLKSLPPADGTPPVVASAESTYDALRGGDYRQPGAAAYVEYCAACHRLDGNGATKIYPALAGNSVVGSNDPTSLIRITLAGNRMPSTAAEPHGLTMPALTHLSDQEVANTLSFVRSAWGNHAPAVPASQVANVRSKLGQPGSAPHAAEGEQPFAAPRDADIAKDARAADILRGKQLLSDTKHLLPDHVGDGLNCTSCHLGEGKVAFASPFVSVSTSFPQYAARAGREITLAERINGCFLRSMNGKAVPVESPEMKAMLAYFEWLSTGLPPKTKMTGRGNGKIDTTLVPDPVKGKAIYEAKCASCHGAEGEGIKDARGEFIFPPLWGEQSFNIGAGMARTYTAAAFVKSNMPVAWGFNAPLGQGGALSDQEALDVAEYFTHQPRPDFPAKVKDWPNGGRPKDARY